ncbi:hypothetical protein E4U46_002064 [Claviceps purpurea]|nr:hypothetical protein E4U46_002064 [Claviceps purpurea]
MEVPQPNEALPNLPLARPPPNFAILADSLAVASEHVRRCETFPAVNIDPIANDLAGIRRRMAEFEIEMREGVDREFLALYNRMTIMNLNISARQSNTVLSEAQPLEPLYSLATMELIPNLPATLLALDVLPLPEVNTILAELGQGIETRVAAARKKLEKAMGLVMRHR